ncbi:MAG: hypothetical protein LBP68_08940, partial [Acidobacteriota bacterium]|nr:hypothetical protein [Acidobacteriota bacterium]
MRRLLPMMALMFLSLVHAAAVYGQIPLDGVVTVQNSKYKTGKYEYAKGIQVEHPPTGASDVSDDEGKFRMAIG